MARTSNPQSSEQKNEGQRSERQTSADSTSMLSPASIHDEQHLSAEEEQAAIQAQLDAMSGVDATADIPGTEKAKYKTLGSYMLLDPTTGDSVTEAGDEVRVSQFILRAEEEGRIEKA